MIHIKDILAKTLENASKKLLKRNGFFKFNQIRDVEIFLLAVGLKVNKNILKKVLAIQKSMVIL